MRLGSEYQFPSDGGIREELSIDDPKYIETGVVLTAAGLAGVKYGVLDKLETLGFISKQSAEIYMMFIKERVQKLESGVSDLSDY